MRTSQTLQRSLLSLLIATALLQPAFAFRDTEAKHGRNFDARVELQAAPPRVAIGAQATALEGLRARLPALAVEIDPVSGATRSLYNKAGYLTLPVPGADNRAVALAFLREQADLLGLGSADVANYEVTDDVQSRASGIRHLYLRQTHEGLPVYNGQLHVNIDRDGAILSINNQFLPELAQAVNRTQPSITAQQAVTSAALQLQRVVGQMNEVSSDRGVRQHTRLNVPLLSEKPIEASLMLLPISAGQARLVWNFQLWTPDGSDISDFTVDAEDGRLWTRISWTADDSYRVYPIAVESPQHTSPLPPADGRVTLENPQAANPSPFGWHDTNGAAGPEFTITQGNNAQAYTDTDANNTPDTGSSPDCGAALNCVFPLDLNLAPSTYRPAAVANLFYFNNMMHDVAYPFGFDEVGGNFQVNNYGRGGAGNDSVQAEAQDGLGTNNANFGTPPDGQRPRMQMFLWSAPDPDRDGDFDNGIIAHEYGHGISNRLVGGPSNVSCLGNNQQAGEGLSDWWSLYYTHTTTNPTASAARLRGIGTYALNQPVTGQGIRNDYYDGDPAVNAEPFENTWTYQSITGAAIPHGVGSRWAQAYWQVTWALIDKYGYDADIDNFTRSAADKGNIRAMYYIIEGLKNTACSPTFTNIRDGILQAAQAAQPYNGADVCTIWGAFAEYGLGENAVSGGSGSTTPTNGFNMPAVCRYLSSTAATQRVCAGNNAVFPLSLGMLFTPPVTLSATSLPAGTSAAFSTNPVTSIPGSTNLTLSGTGGLAAGSYNFNAIGAYAPGPNETLPLTLQVNSTVPSVPTLSAPTNAATGVSVNPALSWTASTQGDEYILEIATDAAFTNIVYTRTVTGTTHTVQTPLNGATQHHWRVRASNACGGSNNSPVFTFTTQEFFCTSPNLAIPDNTTVSSDMVIANTGSISDLNLSVNLAHTYLGDLQLRLRHVASGTEVLVFDRSCGTNENMNVSFDDEATTPITCSTTPPALSGSQRPANALTPLDGLALNGIWRFSVTDAAGGDIGTVNQWCLSGTFTAPGWNGFANGFE